MASECQTTLAITIRSNGQETSNIPNNQTTDHAAHPEVTVRNLGFLTPIMDNVEKKTIHTQTVTTEARN